MNNFYSLEAPIIASDFLIKVDINNCTACLCTDRHITQQNNRYQFQIERLHIYDEISTK